VTRSLILSINLGAYTLKHRVMNMYGSEGIVLSFLTSALEYRSVRDRSGPIGSLNAVT
jgi:hypothetical protein